jgi:hypothetical protein
MILTLPNGRTLSFEQVKNTIATYRRECPAVIDLYDRTNEGPHDEVTAVDLLSLNALNAFRGPPMTPMTEAWVNRSEIVPLLKKVAKEPVEVLNNEALERESLSLRRVLSCVENSLGLGYVPTTKLVHRLRPGLTPIYDSKTKAWYRGIPGTWHPWLLMVYKHVLAPANKEVLKAVQRDLDVNLSLLRIWDIILWQLTPGP